MLVGALMLLWLPVSAFFIGVQFQARSQLEFFEGLSPHLDSLPREVVQAILNQNERTMRVLNWTLTALIIVAAGVPVAVLLIKSRWRTGTSA
jgi:hypothetical protein